MAVVNIREVYPGVSLGLWQMDESPEQLFDLYPHLLPYRSSFGLNTRTTAGKLEFLAIRALMYEMLRVNVSSKGLLSHAVTLPNGQGKPLFRGYHVSISHTKGYAALIFVEKIRGGRDIEYMSDRVERIASKFLRKDERADSLDAKLVHWCAKETVFKLLSEENLLFEMRVEAF